jgi:hypothetical protein
VIVRVVQVLIIVICLPMGYHFETTACTTY